MPNDDLVAFSKRDAGRIDRSVQYTERAATDLRDAPEIGRRAGRARVVKLVGEPSVGRYNFREQRVASNDISLEDRLGGICSVPTAGMDSVNQTCLDANAQVGLRADEDSGTVGVLIEGYDDAGERDYLFVPAQTTRLFRVYEVHDDYLLCRIINGDGSAGTTPINVAKYPEVQKSEYDGYSVLDPVDGSTTWTFTYSDAQERSASDGSDSEDQVIVPRYVPKSASWPGSRIMATLMPITVKDDAGSDLVVQWVELTNRAWAKKAD